MNKVEFNSKGNNAPAYSCNKPGDNSGAYYKQSEVDDLLQEVKDARCLGEVEKILRQYGA